MNIAESQSSELCARMCFSWLALGCFMVPIQIQQEALASTGASEVRATLHMKPDELTHPPLPRVAVDSNSRLQVIRDWLVVGVFKTELGESFNTDFLQASGASEDHIDRGGWMDVLQQLRNHSERVRIARANEVGDLNIATVFGVNQPTPPLQTAAYALCLLTAQRPHRVTLLAGSDDGAVFWLNGKKCAARARGGRDLKRYSDWIELQLGEGENLLAIKIANIVGDWRLSCGLVVDPHLAPTIALESIARSYGLGSFLRQFIVAGDNGLVFDIDDWPDGAAVDAIVVNSDGKEVWRGSVAERAFHLPALNCGLYRMTLSDRRPSVSSAFFIGSVRELVEGFETRTRALAKQLEPNDSTNVGAYMKRLQILEKAASGMRTRGNISDELWPEIDEKLRYTTVMLDDILRDAADGQHPFAARLGLQLRGFRSHIDDQDMYYRIYMPTSYRPGNPIAMVLLPPTAVKVSRPFIASPFVADHYSAVKLSEIAEDLHVALLWPGYRSRVTGAPVDFAHTDEVLADVSRNYDIDWSKLTMFAVSSGGVIASMDAVQHPNRYAAIAYLDASLHRLIHRYDPSVDFSSQQAYRDYMFATDPFEPLCRLSGISIALHNNATDPPHVALVEEELSFVRAAKATGRRPLPTFSRIPGEDDANAKILSWLAKQMRSDASPWAINRVRLRSISSVFGQRFVIVKATGGSAGECKANDILCDRFMEAWYKTNFVQCRVVRDIDLTAAEERDSNLVLLGNENTNAVWKRLGPQMPVRLHRDSVQVRGKQWKGDCLSVQTWMPHPFDEQRSLVLLGCADPERASFGTLELNIDGWYDCAVWQHVASGVCELVEALRFPLPKSASLKSR